MSNQNDLPVLVDDGLSALAMMTDDKQMDRLIRFAEIMATSKATIPTELRNPGDCLAITMQAMNWRMNPFSVAQKTHFISGKIGYEAQLVSAAITNSGAIKGEFNFEWFGPWEKVIGKFEIKKNDKGEYRVPGWKLADEEGIGIRVWATRRNEEEPKVLEVLLAQARVRNSTLWADDPKQQLAYLAQKKWARLYTPGVILGVYTPDELEPIPEKEINPRPGRQTGTQAAEAAKAEQSATSNGAGEERTNLIAELEEIAEKYGIDAYAEHWSRLTKEQRKLVGTDEHERLKKVAQAITVDQQTDSVAAGEEMEPGSNG